MTRKENIFKIQAVNDELKNILELYEAFSKHAAALIYDYNVKTGQIKWLGRIKEITGYERSEFEKIDIEGWSNLIHPDDRDEALRQLEISEKSCSAYDVEYRFRKKDGSYIYMEDNGMFLPDEQHHAFRMIGTMGNITPRKIAQDALSESEERYRNLVELSPDAIIVHSEGKLVFLNTAAANIFRIQNPEEVIGKPILDFVHKDYHARVLDRIKMMSESGTKIPLMVEKFVRMDGTEFDVEVVAMPFIFKGKPSYMVVVRDISDRIKSEKALQESETMYRALFERIPLGLYRSTPSGEIIDANPALINILGYKNLDEILRINVDQIYADPLDRSRISELLMQNDVVMGFEARMKRQDGTVIWTRDTAKIIKNDQDEIMYFEGSLEDISIRKTMEEELIRAKNKAEETDRLKSSFLANISHEIRTPMNGIIGFIELLQNKNLNESKKNEYISVINTSSHQMLKLMNDIIDISKIEAGLIEYNKSRVCINELLDERIDFYKSVTDEKKLKISVVKSLENHRSCILTDEQKLRQVLNNIISNAVRFTHYGSIEAGYVYLNGFLEFYVKDTGIGIPEEHFELIFQRFNQPRETFQKQYSGTGLGLSISKAYIEMMGGKIWLESKPGKGSVFYFTIPYHLVESEIPHAPEIQPEVQNAYVWEGKKLLIAEDEMIHYLYLKELLRTTGVNIVYAANGRDAVDVCNREHTINLVIMDMRMPGMSGYDAIPLIKKINPDLPIIALSAYTLSDDVKKAFIAGCDNFLTKPVKSDELFEMINKYL